MSKAKAVAAPAAQQAPAPQVVVPNEELYTDDMVNAILGTTAPDANFRHVAKVAGGITQHVFITPSVTGVHREGIQQDVVIDYHLNKARQVPGANRVDIFDEQTLFRTENEDVTVLIPYCTGNHWLTCEIKIQKRGLNINTDIQLHDPYGRGELDQDLFATLQRSINTRIWERFIKNTAPREQLVRNAPTNTPSRFDRPRQAVSDGVSCGVIVCEEIRQLANTGRIVPRNPYSKGEVQEIRGRHLEDLKQQGEFRQGLINQYSTNDLFAQVAASIKSSQLELDEDKRLKSQRFLVDNLGKLRKMDGVITSGFLGGSVLVFKNSSNVEAFRIVGNFEKLTIQCKDTKGQYIVQIQRLDANGNLIPDCVDVLSYNNGKLQNAVTIGDTAGSRSRVQNLLDQANGRGVAVKAVAAVEPLAAPKTFVQRLMCQRAVAPAELAR